MRSSKISVCLASLICLVSGYAFAQRTPAASPLAPASEMRTENFRLEPGSRYMVNQLISAKVLSNNSTMQEGVMPSQNVALPPATEFDVLAVSEDGQTARIGLDSDPTRESSDLTVNVADLMAGRLSAIDIQDGLENEDIDLSHEGLFAARKKRGGMTYCFRDVKNTLLRNRVCNHYASGVRAADGYEILQRECGMKPAAYSPRLPINAVCVMSGGRPCGGGTYCGHIQVKVSANMWFGAGYRSAAWLGNTNKPGYVPRRQVGCLVPR